MINVTKSYLPPKEEFLKYVDSIWDNHILTNDGPLLKLFEKKLEKLTGCNKLLVCANGTIVLQMALRAMNISKEVITTPFTYVATTNALLWEGCKPVFADIDKNNFNTDSEVDLAFILGAGYNFTKNFGLEARVKKGVIPVLDYSDGNHSNVVFSFGGTYTFDLK